MKGTDMAHKFHEAFPGQHRLKGKTAHTKFREEPIEKQEKTRQKAASKAIDDIQRQAVQKFYKPL